MNTITNKCYIGETKQNNIEVRWKQHKNKIRESLKKYNIEKQSINIIKHREAMTKLFGIKISQYDLNNILIDTFISFNDASRQTRDPSSTIKKCVKDNKTNRGFIWKKEKSI